MTPENPSPYDGGWHISAFGAAVLVAVAGLAAITGITIFAPGDNHELLTGIVTSGASLITGLLAGNRLPKQGKANE